MAKDDVDVVELLKSYRDAYLECRAMRHAWRLVGWCRGSDGQPNRVLICTRCETERRDWWTHFGGAQRQYTYPTDYRLETGGSGGNGVAYQDLWTESIRRAPTIYESEASLFAAFRKPAVEARKVRTVRKRIRVAS